MSPAQRKIPFMSKVDEARLQALFQDRDSAVSRAVTFGIDLSLTFGRMRLSPEERLAQAEETIAAMTALKTIRPRSIGPV